MSKHITFVPIRFGNPALDKLNKENPVVASLLQRLQDNPETEVYQLQAVDGFYDIGNNRIPAGTLGGIIEHGSKAICADDSCTWVDETSCVLGEAYVEKSLIAEGSIIGAEAVVELSVVRDCRIIPASGRAALIFKSDIYDITALDETILLRCSTKSWIAEERVVMKDYHVPKFAV